MTEKLTPEELTPKRQACENDWQTLSEMEKRAHVEGVCIPLLFRSAWYKGAKWGEANVGGGFPKTAGWYWFDSWSEGMRPVKVIEKNHVLMCQWGNGWEDIKASETAPHRWGDKIEVPKSK